MKIQEWLDKHGLSLDSEFDEETVQRAVTAEIEFSFPDLSEEQQPSHHDVAALRQRNNSYE